MTLNLQIKRYTKMTLTHNMLPPKISVAHSLTHSLTDISLTSIVRKATMLVLLTASN